MADQNVFSPENIKLQPLGPPPGLLEQFNLPPRAIAFIRRNQRQIWVAITVCAVIAVAVSGYTTYRDWQAGKAASALDAALAAKTDNRQMLEQVAREFSSSPSGLWATLELARLDENDNQPEKALARYQTIAAALSAKSPLKPLVLYKIGGLHEREKQLDKALAAFTQLAECPGFEAEASRSMGRVQEELGNKEQAASMYNRYLELTAVASAPGQQAPLDPEREMVRFRLNRLKK